MFFVARILAAALLLAMMACSGDAKPGLTPTTETSLDPEGPPLLLTPNPTRTPAPLDPTPTPFPAGALVRFQPGEPLRAPAFYLYDTADGATYRIVGRGGGGVDGGERWSPDSRVLLGSLCCIGNGFLEFLDVTTNTSTRAGIGDITHFRWSPDGTKIGAVVGQPSSAAGIYVIKRDGTGVRRLVLREGVGEIRWLGEGAIAYWVGQGLFPKEAEAYFRVDVDSESVTELSFQNPVTVEDPRIIFGELSDSGTWVAYDDAGATYLWSAATGVTMQISEGDTRVLWAPHRDRLMVTSFREDELWPQWRLVDAGTMIDLPGVGIDAQWMPGGASIAHGGYQCFVDGPRTFDVTVFDTRTWSSRTLTQTPDDREWGLKVSPTTAIAAFQHIEWPAGTRYLTLIDLESGEEKVLLTGSAPGESLSPVGWSPDGRYLQFHYGGGGEGC